MIKGSGLLSPKVQFGEPPSFPHQAGEELAGAKLGKAGSWNFLEQWFSVCGLQPFWGDVK